MIEIVDFERGTVQLEDFKVKKSTRKKQIVARSDWRLAADVKTGYTHYTYTGDLMNTELYAINLIFNGELLASIELWPRTAHCMYQHVTYVRGGESNFSLFYKHMDILGEEVGSWLLEKQGAYGRKYSWGRAVFRNETDLHYIISVVMNFRFYYQGPDFTFE